MKKWFLLPLCAALALSAGCSKGGGTEAGPEPAPPKEVSQPQEPEGEAEPGPTVEVERLHADKLTYYIYLPEQERYDAWEVEHTGPVTVTGLVEAVGEYTGVEVRLREVSQQKGMVVVDFAAAEQLGETEERERAFLRSAAATIVGNHRSAEWVNYQMEGAPYRTKWVELGEDEPYDYLPLELGYGADEFAALRAQVPYAGLKNLEWLEMLYPTPFPDEQTRALSWLLYRGGLPETSFSDPAQLSAEYLLARAIDNTWYVEAFSQDDTWYNPVLEPIAIAVEDSYLHVGEHVQQSLHAIFGPVQVENQTTGRYQWHEEQGVYTPPHMGGGAGHIPFVWEIVETPTGYLVEVSYLIYGMDSYYGTDGDMIPQDQARAAAQNRPHWQATVERDGDNLVLRGLQELGPAQPE